MKKMWKIYALYLSAVFAAGTAYIVCTERTRTENVTEIVIRNEQTQIQTTETSSFTSAVSKITKNTETALKTTCEDLTEATEIPQYIDINQADKYTLSCLEGIGSALAERIVRYREEKGGFDNIEQLLEVEGIGQAKFEQIKENIYVENPVYYDETDVDSEEYDVPDEAAEHTPTLEEIAPVDLNTADISRLMLLPNVDEKTAMAIISLREQIGGFSNPYELLYIDELTQNEVAEIQEFVTIGQ